MVDQATRYMVLTKLKGKTTEDLVHALKILRRDLAAAHPVVIKISIRGDSDPAWTVSRRGDNTCPGHLSNWLSTIEGRGITFEPSAAHTQAMNPVENAAKRFFQCL